MKRLTTDTLSSDEHDKKKKKKKLQETLSEEVVELPSHPTREKPELIDDLVLYLHNDIVSHGLYRFRDLLNWHKTCHRFYNAWCDTGYLCELLEDARDETLRYGDVLRSILRRGGQGHRVKEYTALKAEIMIIDQTKLTVMFASTIWYSLVPKLLAMCNSLNYSFDSPIHSNTKRASLAAICRKSGDTRLNFVDSDLDLPVRLKAAFDDLPHCMEQFYGWRLTFRRGAGKIQVPAAASLKFSDVVRLELSYFIC